MKKKSEKKKDIDALHQDLEQSGNLFVTGYEKLLDEPCSGLDPISTAKIEEALVDLKREMTVVLVTNNVMQSSRIADRTAFLLQGRLVECKPTKQLFVSPTQKETYDYISGRFG